MLAQYRSRKSPAADFFRNSGGGIDALLSGVGGLKSGGSGGASRRGVSGIGYGSGHGGSGGGIDDLLGGMMGGSGGGGLDLRKRGELMVSSRDFMKSGILTGGRSKTSVMRIVMQNMAVLRYAYNRRLREIPGLAGTVSVMFTIDEFGKVVTAGVVRSTINDAAQTDAEWDGDRAARAEEWERKVAGRITTVPSGYGPEQFLLKNAVRGKYRIYVSYYGRREFAGAGPYTVMAEIYTKYGGRDERRKVVSRQLSNVNRRGDGKIQVAEIEI